MWRSGRSWRLQGKEDAYRLVLGGLRRWSWIRSHGVLVAVIAHTTAHLTKRGDGGVCVGQRLQGTPWSEALPTCGGTRIGPVFSDLPDQRNPEERKRLPFQLRMRSTPFLLVARLSKLVFCSNGSPFVLAPFCSVSAGFMLRWGVCAACMWSR